MSINMTQTFEFETDCLKSFEVMLKTIVPILFKKNGKYTKLSIWGSEPRFWNDGSSSERVWEEMPKVFPCAGVFALLSPDNTYGGATFLKAVATKMTADEAAAEACKQKGEKTPPTRFWVATLSDYYDDYKKERGDTYCSSRDDMVLRTMERVRATAEDDNFTDKMGDGYTEIFNCFDGSIGIGYRMHREPNCGWNRLFISLVHAYYGK